MFIDGGENISFRAVSMKNDTIEVKKKTGQGFLEKLSHLLLGFSVLFVGFSPLLFSLKRIRLDDPLNIPRGCTR